MKAIFMGTPEFSVPALQKLIDMGVQVEGVITQPDRAKGRGKQMQFSPVKELAVKYDLPVFQPQRLRKDEELIRKMREIGPDVIVVVAFGQILPQEVLDIPRLGCVNVHASLLPKYRGAAPIQHVILDGEEKTGVTTMLMDAGLDTGDMLLKAEIPINPKETADSLHDKLAALGGELLEKTLIGLERGEIIPQKQDDSLTGAYASMISKEDGEIDFTQSAVSIERRVRAMTSWPGAYTWLDGKMLKIWECEVCTDQTDGAACGEVTGSRDGLLVQTGEGSLLITSLQLPGKRRMSTQDFLRGHAVTEGTLLGRNMETN